MAARPAANRALPLSAAAQASPNARRALGEARKGAPPVAEEATAAVGPALALTDRNAGREGLAATRGHGEAPEGLTILQSALRLTAPFTQGGLGHGRAKGLLQPLWLLQEAASRHGRAMRAPTAMAGRLVQMA